MPDDARDLGVDQLLRHGRAHFRIGLIVFGDEGELHVLAVDLDAGGIGFLDREARAVLVVFAEVRYAPGQRTDVADLHFRARCAGGRAGFGLLRACLRGFLAATRDDERRREQRKGELGVLHGISEGSGFRGRLSYLCASSEIDRQATSAT